MEQRKKRTPFAGASLWLKIQLYTLLEATCWTS